MHRCTAAVVHHGSSCSVVVENIIILKAPSSRCSEYDGDSPTGADDERSRPNVPRADATARRPRPTLDHSASGCAVVTSFAYRHRPCRRFQSDSSYRSVVSRVCLCASSVRFWRSTCCELNDTISLLSSASEYVIKKKLEFTFWCRILHEKNSLCVRFQFTPLLLLIIFVVVFRHKFIELFDILKKRGPTVIKARSTGKMRKKWMAIAVRLSVFALLFAQHGPTATSWATDDVNGSAAVSQTAAEHESVVDNFFAAYFEQPCCVRPRHVRHHKSE